MDKSKRKGIIYKATNKITGKSYIGQTIQTLKRRIQAHRSGAKNNINNSHFKNALLKYEKDDWEWIILASDVDEDCLGSLEQKFILEYNTFENGYNSTSGGERNKKYSQEMLNKMRVSNTKHGKKYTKIYTVWCRIKNSCYNSKVKDYKQIGARGIVVCDEWLNSFENFYNDVGDQTHDGKILCRIDKSKNYEPKNMIWRSRAESSAFAKRSNKNKDSGHKGVYHSNKRWMARIRINGKKVYLGTFDTIEEAAKAFNDAFIKQYGGLNENKHMP